MSKLIEKRVFVAGLLLAAAGVLPGAGPEALADDDEDSAVIKVMTQNQYLGADLSPLVLAGSDPVAFNAALIGVLGAVGASNYPERVQSLVDTIVKSRADLVGLQEIWRFGCTPTSPTIPDPCGLFGPAFNDHLQATLDALEARGDKYYLAAQSQNLTVESVGFPVPGIPVFLDADAFPDIFVTVVDRDAILARNRVAAMPVTFDCVKPSLDGCNFETVASTSVGGIPLAIERGFVAVDATVRDKHYRFVNTHLEVRFPDPTNPFSRFIQSAQATELIGLLATQPPPPNTRLLVVGDINSAPDDPYPSPTTGPFLTPYQQLVSGLSFQGVPISAAYIDTWNLKRRPSPGLTCCEDADLRNPLSAHDRRIDVVMSAEMPDKVRARTFNTQPEDKTASGLWPSDHATVAARLWFEAEDDDDDDDSDDDDT